MVSGAGGRRVPELAERRAALIGGIAAPQQLAAHLAVQADHVRLDEPVVRLQQLHGVGRHVAETGEHVIGRAVAQRGVHRLRKRRRVHHRLELVAGGRRRASDLDGRPHRAGHRRGRTQAGEHVGADLGVEHRAGTRRCPVRGTADRGTADAPRRLGKRGGHALEFPGPSRPAVRRSSGTTGAFRGARPDPFPVPGISGVGSTQMKPRGVDPRRIAADTSSTSIAPLLAGADEL